MVRERIIETIQGIQDAPTVAEFDLMQRGFRNRGILETKAIIACGLDSGTAAEIGPGPGYLGLEWLKATRNTRLIGIEISSEMISVAEKNRRDYGLDARAEYRLGNAMTIPLEDGAVDHAFSNGSLHEWEKPEAVLAELRRILKPGGRLFISDLKRNLNPLILGLMRLLVAGRNMKQGLVTSVRAAYTKGELEALFSNSGFGGLVVRENPFGLEVVADKG